MQMMPRFRSRRGVALCARVHRRTKKERDFEEVGFL